MKRKLINRVMTITVADSDYQKLTELAQQMGVSRSGVIRTFVRQAVEPGVFVMQTPKVKPEEPEE